MTTAALDEVPGIPIPEQAQGLLRLGHVAVLTAGIERTGEVDHKLRDYLGRPSPNSPADLEALWGSTPQWSSVLARAAEPVPGMWREAVSVHLATDHPFLDLPNLGEGIGLRRLDAIFDVLDVPFSCPDVQEAWVGAMESLADRARSDTEKITEFGANFGIGFAGGWFGVNPQWAQGGVEKAMKFLFDASKETDLIITDLGRLMVIARALLEEIPAEVLVGIRDRLIDCEQEESRLLASRKQGGRTAAEENRHVLVYRAARKELEGLLEESGVEVAHQVVMPQVVGLRLGEAEGTLRAQGLEVEYHDALCPNGQERGIVLTRNWHVVEQSVPESTVLAPGDRVELKVKKFSDPD